MPKEVAVLEIPIRAELNSFSEELKELTQKSQQIYLLLSPDAVKANQNQLQQLALGGISLDLELGGLSEKSPSQSRYESFDQRSPAAQCFDEIRRGLPLRLSLSAHLRVHSAGIEFLAPTLVALAQGACPWVFLDMRPLRDQDHQAAIRALKSAFSLLRIHQLFNMEIHFHELCSPVYWNAVSSNSFCGPNRVDLDVANTCTHNCVFCGLYGPEFQAEQKSRTPDGSLPRIITQHMAQKIDTKVGLDLIESLPLKTRLIQFGGEGDPLTHPDIMQMITAARERGCRVEILSNFAYLSPEKIQLLHDLAGDRDLRFIVNLGAATAETYTLIRPNQKAATFEKVLDSIRLATALREQAQIKGLHMTLMSVITKWNYREMEAFVRLGSELKVEDVWLKPLELHAPKHRQMLPSFGEQAEFRAELDRALRLARKLGVALVDAPSADRAEKFLPPEGELQ